jgi:hypothetical protein
MTNRRIFLCTYTLLVLFLFSIVHFVHAQEATTSVSQEATTTLATPSAETAATTTPSASSTTLSAQAASSSSAENVTVPDGIPLTPEEQQRVINLAANISNRMDAMANRQQDILMRLQTRIQKMSQQGYDVSDTTIHINDTLRFLTNARQRLSSIDSDVQTAVTAGNPQFTWPQVVETFNDVKSILESSKRSMLEATGNLELIVRENRMVAQ